MKDNTESHNGWLGRAVGAGAVSGVVTRALCQPFDVVKIRFQLQVEPVSKISRISKYQSLSQAVVTVIKEEGVRGLWRGHTPAQLLSVLFGGVQFSTFETLINLTKVSKGKEPLGFDGDSTRGKLWSAMLHFGCGAAAGTSATLVSFPFDVIRTRFVAQGNTKGYTWTGHGLFSLWTTEGLQGLFRGLTPTILQAAPHSAALFSFYHLFTQLFIYFEIRSILMQEIMTGAVAGIAAKTVVYPLDLARKRMQLQGFQQYRQGFGKNFTCKGLYNCFRLIVKEEGVGGLYKGLIPSWWKAAVTTTLYFTVYAEVFRYTGSSSTSK